MKQKVRAKLKRQLPNGGGKKIKFNMIKKWENNENRSNKEAMNMFKRHHRFLYSSTAGIFGLNMSFVALKLVLTMIEPDKKSRVNNVRISFFTHVTCSLKRKLEE